MKQTNKYVLQFFLFFSLLVLNNNSIISQNILPTPNISKEGMGIAALNNPFLPIRHKGGANLFWRQEGREFLKVSSFSGNFTSGALYSELYSDFIKDIVRISLGTTMASVENDSTGIEKKLHRLISGGGLVTINFHYPILSFPFNNNFGSAVILSLKSGADLPVAGNSTIEITGSMDFGVDFHLIFSTDSGKLQFPFYLRTAYVIGTNDFKNTIHLQDNFGYIQFSGGFKYEVLRINLGLMIYGPETLKSIVEPALSVSIVNAIN